MFDTGTEICSIIAYSSIRGTEALAFGAQAPSGFYRIIKRRPTPAVPSRSVVGRPRETIAIGRDTKQTPSVARFSGNNLGGSLAMIKISQPSTATDAPDSVGRVAMCTV